MTDWESAPLDDNHQLDAFDCGKPTMDSWLKNLARRAQRNDIARTYVWTAPGSPQVVAYYSIAPTQIVKAELTGDQAGGFGTIPAYLLARLALDKTLHRKGLGGELLLDALEIIVRAADASGGRMIVVDALDDAAVEFYLRHDFVRLKQADGAATTRMGMKVATARDVLSIDPGEEYFDPDQFELDMLQNGYNGPGYQLAVDELTPVIDALQAAASKLDSPRERIDVLAVIATVLNREPTMLAIPPASVPDPPLPSIQDPDPR